jgi:hypothetical protein
MEPICSSETSVDFQRTTRGYIPEDSALHKYSRVSEIVFMIVIGLMRSYLKSPSSNHGPHYIIECLAVSLTSACLLAGAGSDLFRRANLDSRGVQLQVLTRDWYMSKLLPLSNQDVFKVRPETSYPITSRHDLVEGLPTSPAACHLLACWFAERISSTLKMEAICSLETSVETQRTKRRHIPEDGILHKGKVVPLLI